MARAALIQSHCCRMNTSSESPERVEKTEFEESKREIERVIEFPPCVWENKGKQGRVNMHEGKSNCEREGKRDNKRGEWTILNCRLRDFFPPALFYLSAMEPRLLPFTSPCVYIRGPAMREPTCTAGRGGVESEVVWQRPNR